MLPPALKTPVHCSSHVCCWARGCDRTRDLGRISHRPGLRKLTGPAWKRSPTLILIACLIAWRWPSPLRALQPEKSPSARKEPLSPKRALQPKRAPSTQNNSTCAKLRHPRLSQQRRFNHASFTFAPGFPGCAVLVAQYRPFTVGNGYASTLYFYVVF